MQNDHFTETSRRSRAALAREKKAGASGMLLTTVGFLIVLCVILYSVYASHTGSARKKAAAAQPPGSSQQTGDSKNDAPLKPGQAGVSNSADRPDAADASGAADAGNEAGNSAAPDTSNQGAAVLDSDGNPGGNAAGNTGGIVSENAGQHPGGQPSTVTSADPVPAQPAKPDPGKDAASAGQQRDAGSKPSASSGNAPSKLPATYVVRQGDTLSTISMKFYHSKQYVSLLAKRNGIVFVNDMKVGTAIKIPALTSVAGAADSGKQTEPNYTKATLPATYLVRPGDTLYSISVKFYGSGKEANFIAKYNKLEEKTGLQAGASLTIPAKPAK